MSDNLHKTNGTADNWQVILASMTEGLHALLFGVMSSKDPEHAYKAISDGGEIHEFVHSMIRLLPPKDER